MSVFGLLADRLAAADMPARQRWADEARPTQLPPGGQWRFWLACAGRGWGKTRACAEWVAEQARTHPGARVALVAITFADGRDTMVEGDSGLLSVLDDHELRGGSVDSAWNRSLGELFLANGSRFKIYSSEKPRQLRGPQHHFAWGDEPAYWLDAAKGTARDTTFSNLNIGLRLKARPGWPDGFEPRAVFATTPRRIPLLKIPDKVLAEKPAEAGLLQRRDVVVVRGRTADNLSNLSRSYYDAVIAPMEGTTLGRQELDGILLADVEGALWTEALIDKDRIETPPPLSRRLAAFDPAGGDGHGHDEHGVIVAGSAGRGPQAQFYILADHSRRSTPTDAARTLLTVCADEGIDTIVYEKNQGQDWIPTVIRNTYDAMILAGDLTGPLPRLVDVSAGKSKKARATPVQGLYEQHRVHHVGLLAELEEQMTSWVPDETPKSPDRIDALVWAVWWLAQVGAPARSGLGRVQIGGRQRPRLPMPAAS